MEEREEFIIFDEIYNYVEIFCIGKGVLKCDEEGVFDVIEYLVFIVGMFDLFYFDDLCFFEYFDGIEVLVVFWLYEVNVVEIISVECF